MAGGMGMMAAMPGMMMPGGFGYDMMGMSAMAGMAGMGLPGMGMVPGMGVMGMPGMGMPMIPGMALPQSKPAESTPKAAAT